MERAIDVVVRSFEWFNSVMAKPGHLITREEIERQFTPDAQMIANGQVKCAGIDAHLKHFQELQKKLKSFRIRLPLKESISTAAEAAAYYQIEYVAADGSTGIIHDCALWRIRDNKLALMVETVSFEGKDVPLENHA
jgi:hypothetical protein